jgi:hypothetical protein
MTRLALLLLVILVGVGLFATGLVPDPFSPLVGMIGFILGWAIGWIPLRRRPR